MMRFLLFIFGLLLTARAELPPSFIAHDYWGDGKAEFNLYEGRESRYGKLHPAEMLHIVVRESFAPEAFVKADDWSSPEKTDR